MKIQNKKPSDFTVGQKLFYVPNRRGQFSGDFKGRKIVVASVGRKWVTIDGDEQNWYYKGGRFDPSTGYVDGGQYSSPAIIYLSEDDYKKEMYRRTLWDALYTYARNNTNPPESLDVEVLAKLADMVGIKEQAEEAYRKRISYSEKDSV